LVQLVGLLKDFPDASLKLLGKDTEVVVKAVLLVGMVLEPQLRDRGMTQKVACGVPLAELLEAEAPVSEDLSSDVSGGGDFYAHAGHLKDTPMLVLGAVTQQAVSIRVVLVSWV
jgi:hypothetical protein